MFKQLNHGHEMSIGHETDAMAIAWRLRGLVAVSGMLYLILSLFGCASPRKEYVVDYARGNDVTAQGSRERPCQTEVQCQMLAERDGVRSYWMVYQ